MPIVFCSFGVAVFVIRVSGVMQAQGRGAEGEKLAAEREILQNDIVHRIRRRLSLLG